MDLRRLVKVLGISAALLFPLSLVRADMSSGNFRIQADSLNSGGQASSSTNYALTDTVAEAVIGEGTSASYQLQDGFWHMVNSYLILEVDSNSQDLGDLLPGTPVTGQTTITVTTDAWNGYTLAAAKNHQLLHTNTTTQIPDQAGTVATPVLWQTPNDSGFGFTLTNGTDIEAKWGSTPNFKYAAFPDTAETIHAKEGFQSASDQTTVQYKVDVADSQLSGDYSAEITYTAVGSI